MTKISDFCNEVNDYLIKPPYYYTKQRRNISKTIENNGLSSRTVYKSLSVWQNLKLKLRFRYLRNLGSALRYIEVTSCTTPCTERLMPSMSDSTDLPLCASFSTFFAFRLKFCTDNRKNEFIPPPEIKCPLTCFEAATSEEVRKLSLTSPTKTCALDPVPTSLLISCVDVLQR